MFHIILFQPEIPPNTGNIIRLSANTGAGLHLIQPLGFSMEDRLLRRAGLDYHEWASVRIHSDLNSCLEQLSRPRLFALSTRASTAYTKPSYRPGDAFLFGPETRGLPKELLDGLAPEYRLRLPMLPDSRSLNLSNSVAVMIYEAWRQCGFDGAA